MNRITPIIRGLTLAGLLAITGASLHASEGEVLEIDADLVNVRAEPTTASAILIRLPIGRRVLERAREDDWVRVETDNRARPEGYIHQSLLIPAGEAGDAYRAFRIRINDLLQAQHLQPGFEPFTAVEYAGGGDIWLTAHPDFLTQDDDWRRALLTACFNLWNELAEPGMAAGITILGPDRTQYMLMFR